MLYLRPKRHFQSSFLCHGCFWNSAASWGCSNTSKPKCMCTLCKVLDGIQGCIFSGSCSLMSGTMFKRSNEPRPLIRTWPEESWKTLQPWGLFKLWVLFLDDGKILINAAAVESTLTGEYDSPCQYRIYIFSLHVSRLHYSVNRVGRSSAYFGRTVPQVLFN